jgi:phage tail sheath protein FI
VTEPRLVTSWEQFKIQFGDFHTANKTLALAVYGFFSNGGTRCWVIRVASLTSPTNVADALAKFEAIDEIAIVAAPGAVTVSVQNKVIDHCELLQDRFAILDGQQATTATVAAIKSTTKNSNYAALYFPWLKVSDPVTDASTSAPPSGHLAGLYARVDQVRGVHKAPANEIVRGADDLDYLVTKNEQDGLNPSGINVIRNLNGNIRVWGARTLGGDANGEYTYINVRRLMNFLRESIDESTQFVVFEPNNLALWQKIIRTVRAFLTEVWRDGALFGATAEEAFYVKCDESLNPPQVRMVGQVITEIGVAIVRPAEFVIFRISQITLNA